MRVFFKTIFLFILFNNFPIKGQEKTFVATYKIGYTPINFDSTLKSKDSLKPNNIALEIYEKIKKGEEELKKIKYKLFFKKNKSIFYKEPNLNIDKKQIRLLSLILSLNDGIYFSGKDGVLLQKNSYGEDFLIKMPSVKWNITNEQKKIGKYICYKAKTTEVIDDPRGEKRVNIEAWFTPEIPFNFGPKNYNGLPGLIVELKVSENLTFQLTSLIKTTDKKIKEPKKGKKITLKEFNILSKTMYENRGN